MNIVKFKDKLMPDDIFMADFFNKNLKGKYAYWVQMRYIFPLDSLCYKTYIKYEQYDPVHFLSPDILPHIDLYSEKYCMIDFANDYIDIEVTEQVNNVYDYIIYNNYTSDPDIDITKLRMFRTWLASELVKFNISTDGTYLGKFTEDQMHMLEYYKNNMFNEVVKQLSVFGKQTYESEILNNSCGCCNSNMSSLYNISDISLCDALTIYKSNIHKLMVQTFEKIEFWQQFHIDFIKTFKKYIDNILKNKMPINTGNTTSVFTDCKCSSTTEFNKNEDILKQLSIALNYIIDNDIKGHVNYIHDALYNWAEYLYDYMSWEINIK
jgi:hypothetical protein